MGKILENDERIKTIKAKIKSVMETIEPLEKQKDVYVTQQKILLAVEINKTISDHQTERGQLQEQLQQVVKLADEPARHKESLLLLPFPS